MYAFLESDIKVIHEDGIPSAVSFDITPCKFLPTVIPVLTSSCFLILSACSQVYKLKKEEIIPQWVVMFGT